MWKAYTEASWDYNTNITDHNKEVMVREWCGAVQGQQQPGKAAGTQGTLHRASENQGSLCPL